MTTVVVVNCPEGLVLAADGRMSIKETPEDGPTQVKESSSDTAMKILSFKEPHNFVGAVTYGLGKIDRTTVYDYLPEFEQQLPKKRIGVDEFAQNLREFLLEKWDSWVENLVFQGREKPTRSMDFLVSGFNEKEQYGRIYEFGIGASFKSVGLRELSLGNKIDIYYRGKSGYVSRIWLGYPEFLPKLLSRTIARDNDRKSEIKDYLEETISNLDLKMHFSSEYLQDSVELAKLLVKTEIDAQKLTRGPNAPTGGPIRVYTITSQDGLQPA